MNASHRRTESTEGLLGNATLPSPPHTGLNARRVLSADLSALEKGQSHSFVNGEFDFLVNGRAAHIRLKAEELAWQWTSSLPCLPFLTRKGGAVRLADIIAVQTVLSRTKLSLLPCSRFKLYRLDILAVSRSPSQACRWTLLHIFIESQDEDTLVAFGTELDAGVQAAGGDRPHQLAVIINPKASGKDGHSLRTYTRTVQPIFKAARIKVQLYETQHAGHAHDIVKQLCQGDIGGKDGIDGIVAVGGDGVFHELLNGFLDARAANSNSEALARLRIAHIPCGSTDAVACSLNGIRCAFTAAAHIALGDRTPLDALRVDAGGSTRFACCIAAYGFLADVVSVSEKARWLGPVRYDLVGAYTLATNKSYPARVSYLTGSGGSRSPNEEDVPCYTGCAVCHSASFSRQPSCGPSAPFMERADSALERYIDEGWVVINGRWMSIMLIVHPCRSDKTPSGMARHAHLADGRMKLVLVQQCNPLQYLRFLLTMARNGLTAGQLPYVKVIDAVAVKVDVAPGDPHTGWNLDGELIPTSHLAAEVHGGVVDVFSRGVEQLQQCGIGV